MVFCNSVFYNKRINYEKVTILILIDGFLQFVASGNIWGAGYSHNPYFNRWFSAIVYRQEKTSKEDVTILILIDGFLQYFKGEKMVKMSIVTILILIDGFLQYINKL